jgi:hypothetical protein
MMLNPNAEFPLARQLRSPEGAPLGELSSFVSGLYFRGKKTYAEFFGKPPRGLPSALLISPCEGLRFLHERLTIERMRAWSQVPIDERNPRFTRPLVEHAVALKEAHGKSTRFVLLGSIATDKYVRPLLEVFGSSLLFPPAFVGRGDMSRGGLLLRAVRLRNELEYAPIERAARHGARPPRLPKPGRATLEVVILVGLPGAGKTTFFRERFAESHVHISKDNLRNNRRPERRQRELTERALMAGHSVVLDNTNASAEERAATIAQARKHSARVIGYFFDCSPRECLARNALREGRARIPQIGIYATAKRLRPPDRAEGFDELYVVRSLPDHRFRVG